MKIIQLSDLHIKNDSNIDEIKNKIDKLHMEIIKVVKNDELMIFCICGDIIDTGLSEGFEQAKEVIEYLKSKFDKYQYRIEVVPGNHDLCNKSLNEFDIFIAENCDCDYKYNKNSVIVSPYEDFNLILLNSSYHKNYESGEIDLRNLETKLLKEKDKDNIIVMHHTIISECKNDKSGITDAYNFINLLKKYKTSALIHGHTHGYSDITIADNCKVIGVGPLLKHEEDINNQFNIIDLKVSKINEVLNYRYSKDTNDFNKINTFYNTSYNNFKGTSISKVYNEVSRYTKEYKCINNFNMNIVSKYNDFKEEIEEIFSDNIKIAEKWQCKEVPEDLYYNHGEYMNKNSCDSIEYIIKQLKNKSTSNRAVIPLINIEDVLKSGDDFLPSLNIIQFGFKEDKKEELYITVYLRALEVNHFLKINISEIYLLCKKIKEYNLKK